MSSSGWYPDPSGEPNRFRYWDGSSWSNETTGDPNSPAPGATPAPPATPPTPPPAASPTPPTSQPTTPNPYVTGGAGSYGQGGQGSSPYGQGSYGQGSYGQGSAPYGQQSSSPYGQGSSPYGQAGYGQAQGAAGFGAPSGGPQGPTHTEYGRPKWLLPLIALVAVLLIAGGVVTAIALTGGDDDDNNNSAGGTSQTPTGTESDPGGETTDPGGETTDPGGETSRPPGADFVNCEGGDPMSRESSSVTGSIVGGGLTLGIPDEYIHEPFYGEAFAFAFDTDVAYMMIETYWISAMLVGKVEKANGFTSLQQAAHAIQECMTRTDTLFSDFSGSRDLHSRAITVDGHDAWSYRSEIRVDSPQVEAEGDIAEVTVVDIGDPDYYAIFIGVTPIGDDALEQVLDQAVADLKVG